MNLLKELPRPASLKRGWPWTKESTALPEADGMEWPLISVITPSFNQGIYIEETIRSVLLQNYPRIEFIVMDGGSTDQTIEIIKKYDQWISSWVSEADGGQSDAINKGMLRCHGDIICWINSDDWLHPGALFTIAQQLKLNEPAWLIGKAEVTTSLGKRKYIKSLSDQVTKKTFRQWNLDWIPQQATAWNRMIFNQCGVLDESLHYAMDVDYFYRLYLISKPTMCDAVLAGYRIHGEAKTINQSATSIRETADWIARNLLEVNSKDHASVVEYIEETILLQKKHNRIRRHQVLGRIVSFWQRYINRQIQF